jgi:hypothetical protein
VRTNSTKNKQVITMVYASASSASSALDVSLNSHDTNANNIPNNVTLQLVMSCEVFWDYEVDVTVNRLQYDPKYTNRPKDEAFQKLSQFLCSQMKQHIEDCLIDDGKRDMLSKLEEVYPKFHIHGLTAHEILYPRDPTNSAHSRGDEKIFICTLC